MIHKEGGRRKGEGENEYILILSHTSVSFLHAKKIFIINLLLLIFLGPN